MSACRSCQAPIVWVRTRARKLMPLDSTIALENATERDATATFEELRKKLGADAVVSHFATCPDAARHRR